MVPDTSKSDFAVISYCPPGITVLGLEAIPAANPTYYNQRLIEHIRRQYCNPYLVNAKLVVFIEGNMGDSAFSIMNLIREYFPTAVFPGTMGPSKVGVLTTHDTKLTMCTLFQNALSKEDISISKDFVTTDPKPEEILEKARNQLIVYSRLTLPGKTPFQENRVRFSGKGEDMSDKDDLAIVFQLAAWCNHEFFTSSRWVRYHAIPLAVT